MTRLHVPSRTGLVRWAARHTCHTCSYANKNHFQYGIYYAEGLDLFASYNIDNDFYNSINICTGLRKPKGDVGTSQGAFL